MKNYLCRMCVLALTLFGGAPAHAFSVFNLNVFDQLQGEWSESFRRERMEALAEYGRKGNWDLVVFQEAVGESPGSAGGGSDSPDGALWGMPFRHYVHEMTGKDGASYGYWMGAKKSPDQWIEDGFSFPGGVARKVQGAYWREMSDGKCLGVLSLHWSYQSSAVRQKEAQWLQDWVRGKESLCDRWLVVGDFNADSGDKEIQMLLNSDFTSLLRTKKPTVGAFNPIRRIYGENTPSRTIDWPFGWQLPPGAVAEVVLDKPVFGDLWVSDHAALEIHLPL
jgi:endonuclease/exonuclease/phosphatase family metal-dependent hydrolase